MTDSAANENDDSPSELLESWEVVAAYVEPFLEAWESGQGPPLLEDYLPEEAQYRQDVLIELIKVDIDYRQQFAIGGNLVEDYCEVFPELRATEQSTTRGRVPTELIVEEYQIRKSAGDSVRIADYFDRFPNQRQELQDAFAFTTESIASSLESTASQAVQHADFDAGDHLDDFYILTKLGQGAFASVYLARQEAMQRLVALKVSADKGSEAQTLAQLDHPHIVRVYDQTRVTTKRLLLLYMQFAPGGTLHTLLARSRETSNKSGQLVCDVVRSSLAKSGVLSPEDVAIKVEIQSASWPELVCHYGIELAQALNYAHRHGVLHRDLKPANVLLDAYGSCKLADFNISFSSELEGQNAAASFGGSVAYMPPEQLLACHPIDPGRPEDLDERSDLFALGVVLWELATGSRPYDESELGSNWTNVLELMCKRRSDGPTVGEWPENDSVARALRETLQTCLQPNKSDRFSSAGELADVLALCREPRVASLLVARNSTANTLLSRWPVPAVMIATFVPNGVAAWFAWFYNYENLETSLADPAVMSMFQSVQATINGVAFPLAMAFLVWFALPVSSFLRADPAVEPRREDVGRRMLRLGIFAAILGVVEWGIAGMAYPVALHVLTEGLPVAEWGHFFFSHLLSGMIAAAYPFYLITTVAVAAFLPRWLTSRLRVRSERVTSGRDRFTQFENELVSTRGRGCPCSWNFCAIDADRTNKPSPCGGFESSQHDGCVRLCRRVSPSQPTAKRSGSIAVCVGLDGVKCIGGCLDHDESVVVVVIVCSATLDLRFLDGLCVKFDDTAEAQSR